MSNYQIKKNLNYNVRMSGRDTPKISDSFLSRKC